MSSDAYLFFDPGRRDLETAARALADALDMKTSITPSVVAVYSDRLSDDIPLQVGGDIDWNIYSEDQPEGPEDEAAFDGCPMVWNIRTYPRLDEDHARYAALTVLESWAEKGPGWPMVLTYEFELLDATFDPNRGLRTFPPGTRADGTGRAAWG